MNKDNKVTKISFYGSRGDNYKVRDEIGLFVNFDNLPLYSLDYDRLTTNKDLTKPIISLGLKKIKNNYYLTEDKLFAKN